MIDKTYHLFEIKNDILSLKTISQKIQFSVSVYEVDRIDIVKSGVLKQQILVTGINGVIFEGETGCTKEHLEKCVGDISDNNKIFSLDERKKIIQDKLLVIQKAGEARLASLKEAEGRKIEESIKNTSDSKSKPDAEFQKNKNKGKSIFLKIVDSGIMEASSTFLAKIMVNSIPESNNRPYGNYHENQEKYTNGVPCNVCFNKVAWGVKSCPSCGAKNPYMNRDEMFLSFKKYAKFFIIFVMVVFIINLFVESPSKVSERREKERQEWNEIKCRKYLDCKDWNPIWK